MIRRLTFGLTRCVVAVAMLSGWSLASAYAQAPLAEEARAAKARYRAIEPADLERAEQRLRRAMGEVETYLASGREDRARGWRRYLRWEVLRQQLDRSETPDLEALNGILVRLYRDEIGLERKPFLGLREALHDYMNLVLFSSTPGLEQSYQQYLEELARRLENYEQQPAAAEAETIGQIAAWLERSGQAQSLVEGIRERFQRPNIYAHISQQLIDDGFRESVDEHTPVVDCILGTSIRGTAHTTGTVVVDLVPNSELATFDIRMRGQAVSNNVGVNGPVTIYSGGSTTIHAASRFVIHPTGVYAGAADAVCRTRSVIEGIAAHLRLTERVAWKRALQTKPQAEQIASARAEDRVERQMNEQTTEMVQQVNEKYREGFRDPLVRRGAFPELLKFTTTDRTLHVQALQASRFQLAAPSPPPALPAGYDMSLRMHESAVANTSESMLAGKTMTDERLAELVEAVTGEVPEELQITPEKDPWSITFAASRPINATFSGNTLRLAVRGRQFTRGNDEINYTIEISALYTLERQGQGARLVRQGPPEVVFLNLSRLGVSQITFKTFLENKFAALFKPEFNTTGLELPGRWQAAGKLQLAQLEADQGWLSVAWRPR